VFVGNSGAVSNYTGFKLNQGGHLRQLGGSVFSLPSGTMPGDVLFNGDGMRSTEIWPLPASATSK
jgi:hypothetical protein